MADEPGRPDVSADDVTVARRAHVRALERLATLINQIGGALKVIKRSQRALGKTSRGRRLAKALAGARVELESALSGSPRHWRIDRQVVSRPDSPGPLQFLGMWRPPTPPASPQELGAAAVVCRCLEHLSSAAQVRQHWETGCFDLPDYERLPATLAALIEEIEAAERED